MRAVPHPLLSGALAILWMVLTRFSPGQFVLGAIAGLASGWAYAALTPASVRLRRPDLMARLFIDVFVDIVRSNIAVARLILSDGRHGARRSGFVRIPLALEQRAALAVLAIIVTSTPGTVWVGYEPESGELLIHVFDLIDEETWRHTIKSRYEAPLLEIFA